MITEEDGVKWISIHGYINVYADRSGNLHYDFYQQKENADNFKHMRIACVEVNGIGEMENCCDQP